MAIPGIDVTERPWQGSADSRLFAQDPGPGNPNVGRPSLRGQAPAAVPTAQPAAAPPTTIQRAMSSLRGAHNAAEGNKNYFGPVKPNTGLRGAVGAAGRLASGAGTALGGVLAVGAEAKDAYDVHTAPGSTGVDTATQVASGAGRLAAAGLGAKAGAALGAFGGPAAPVTVPLGAALGGAAGYFGADKLIEGGRSLAGVDTRDPAEQVAQRAAPPAATTLRTRPEDTFAGPPAAAAGAASPTADANPGNVTRNGNSYEGTNVSGNITVNGFAPGAGLNLGSGPNAQNMAAANNLAATDSLRSQGAALSGQPAAGGSGMPAMPQTLHSGNSWEARNNLRNLEVGASSIYDSQSRWGNKAKAAADANAYQNAQAMDTAARTGSDPGSISRNSAQASMFGSKTTADASKENSRNSLRGTMYTADTQLGAKQMEMQQRLQQQQLKGEIFRAAGGKPEAAAQIAASYGLDAKDFTDMASASQTRDHNATTNARKRLEGMAVRSDDKGGTVVDPGRLARLESTLGKMAPGWQHMSEPEQAKHLATAEAGVNLIEGLNDRRNNGFWQSIGVDGSSASLDKLPIEAMKGGRLKTVKALEGAFTGGGVERKDYVIETEGGHKLYLPRDKVNQGELELLKSRGVDISSLQK